MDKNTLTGLLLIGAILLGFTLYSENQMSKQREVQHKIDSVNNIAKEKELAAWETKKAAEENKTVAQQPTYSSESLNIASVGNEEFYTLENDKIIAKISNKGAAIRSVELKEYKTYTKEPLYLFKEKDAVFNLSFYTNTLLNTSDFYFTNKTGNVTVSTEGETKSMTLSLPLSETASIDYIYTIKQGSNMVDFDIKLNGTSNILSPGQSNLFVNWSNVSPQQERGFSYENTYTTIGYMSPNSSDLEELTVSTDTEREEISSKVKWVAFKQQFFSSILIAKDAFENANLSYETFAENSGNIKHFEAKLALPYTMETKEYSMQFFFGGNEYTTLKAEELNLEKLVPLGWGIFGWVNKYIIIPTFNFLGGFISNYGIIILLMTIFIKILLFGFTYKSYISMANMRLLKPEIEEINKKFPDKNDAMKKQQATMELYRKAGVNPMGGCLPMLLQMPIIIALFRFFPASIELRGKSFLWADDLSSYDSVLDLPFNIPFYGDHISLFALLMGASLLFSTKLNSQNNVSNQQMPGMNFMMTYMMPIMLVVWFNSYSSGLSYYYLLANVITIGQMLLMRKFVDDDKLHAKMKANAKKPRKKSKWQQKMEELAKQQEQMRNNKK